MIQYSQNKHRRRNALTQKSFASALPPDVRRGFASPSEAKSAAAMPLVRALLQQFWAKGRTRGRARLVNQMAGEAEPRRTSGGRAAKKSTFGAKPRRNVRSLFFFGFFLFLGTSGYGQTNVNSADLTMPAYGNLAVQEGYFSGADNARLFYRIVGNGSKTIVFVHGGPGLGIDDGGYDLEAIAAKGFRFIMYNQRGGGRSELVSDKSKLGIDYYVRDLEALRQHFGLRKMNLIGLSWGSGVVAYYAVAYSKNINRIVFLSPMPPTEEFSKQRNQKIRSLIDSKTLAEINEVHKRSKTASDADLPKVCRELNTYLDRLYVADPSHLVRARGDTCRYTPQAIRGSETTTGAAVKSLGHWNFQSMLKRIRVPSLVIEGARTNVPSTPRKRGPDGCRTLDCFSSQMPDT